LRTKVGGRRSFEGASTRRTWETLNSSSGRAASSVCPTSCSGSLPTPSSTSPTSSGRSSIGPSSSARWPSMRRASEDSVDAPRRRRAAPPSDAVLYRRERRRRGSSTSARVLVALPWAAFAILITVLGGAVFALAVIGLGVVALHELYRMLRAARPLILAGFLTLAALVLAAEYGGQFQMMLVVALSVPLTFLLAAE